MKSILAVASLFVVMFLALKTTPKFELLISAEVQVVPHKFVVPPYEETAYDSIYVAVDAKFDPTIVLPSLVRETTLSVNLSLLLDFFLSQHLFL